MRQLSLVMFILSIITSSSLAQPYTTTKSALCAPGDHTTPGCLDNIHVLIGCREGLVNDYYVRFCEGQEFNASNYINLSVAKDGLSAIMLNNAAGNYQSVIYKLPVGTSLYLYKDSNTLLGLCSADLKLAGAGDRKEATFDFSVKSAKVDKTAIVCVPPSAPIYTFPCTTDSEKGYLTITVKNDYPNPLIFEYAAGIAAKPDDCGIQRITVPRNGSYDIIMHDGFMLFLRRPNDFENIGTGWTVWGTHYVLHSQTYTRSNF